MAVLSVGEATKTMEKGNAGFERKTIKNNQVRPSFRREANP
jgi:hypothetical protein